jgi:monoamine oxidase
LFDCVIIGGGPAGLAAASSLSEAGADFVLVEAQGVLGGRAQSGALSDGTPIERGAQQIHGPTIATWEYVHRHGLTTHYLVPGIRGVDAVFSGGRWTDGDALRKAAYQRLMDALVHRFGDAASDGVSVHQALVESGMEGDELAAADGRFNVLCPIPPDLLSSRAASEALRFNGTGLPNFAIVEGYSEMWRRMAAPFENSIELNAPVTAIDWSEREGEGVVVSTLSGEFVAVTAIVTLPVGVMQAGGVQFEPELPEGKAEAIDGLVMGPTIKAFAEFKRPWWEDTLGNVAGFRHASSVFHGWEALFWDRPGPPVLSAMIGLRGAELSGDETAVRTAFLGDLSDMFPDTNIESELVSLEVWDWTADPYARGSLSVAQVGGHRLRDELGWPTPPLFWAGEATATNGNATGVHGALESGRRAAQEALHAVRPLYATDAGSRLDWRAQVPRPTFTAGR